MQAWCLLEESEHEQWQEVISRRSNQRAKKVNQASLLSVESSHSLSPKKIVEVKDKWVTVRVTMDSGAAGHVMQGVQRCITFRSANVVNPSLQCKKVVLAGNIVVLGAHSKHSRRNSDQAGRERWCVHNGHVDLFAPMKQVQFSSGRDNEWSSRFRLACKRKKWNEVQRQN